MVALNCWEHMKCGREPGGSKVQELGVCCAATYDNFNSVNGGKAAGRIYWMVAGTLCNSEVQGTFAKKNKDCLICPFFHKVEEEEGSDFVMTKVF